VNKIISILRRLLPSSLDKAVRPIYTSIRSKLRSMNRLIKKSHSIKNLKSDLSVGGIVGGDKIMVHSAMSTVGKVAGPEQIIQSLLDTVGLEGTVMMPTYGSAEKIQQGMQEGKIADLRTQKSQLGKITEVFRTWPGVIRSSHPFSSVCALGNQAEFIISRHAMDPHICHAESPMGRIIDFDAKIVGIGVTIAVGMAVSHYLEDTGNDFPIDVYSPPFKVTYLDNDGVSVTREVLRYDPQTSATRIGSPNTDWICEKLTQHFTKLGIYQAFQYGNAESWVMHAQPVLAELRRLATKGITIYLSKEKWKSMNSGNESIDSW